jgi:hypothetical protein
MKAWIDATWEKCQSEAWREPPPEFIDALKYDVARRDSNQKDAARWRFLVDNSFDKDGVTQFHVWEHSWEPHSQTGEPTEWKQRVRGPALDHFIDRAIEAAHGITGEKK